MMFNLSIMPGRSASFLLKILLISLIMLPHYSAEGQQRRIADQIVAVVNDHTILQSDVDQRLAEFMQQTQTRNFDERTWYYVLESLIDNFVLVEKARMDSIIISDAEVDRMLNQRINILVQQLGSERELEQAFGQPIIEIKEQYGEQFRQDMKINRVRQKMIERVNITRPEVKEFFESIPADSLPTIPESVSLSQITILPPPKPDARENARNLAIQLRDSILHHGVSMEELAIRYSDGPTAASGGQIPMLPTTDLLPEYAAAAAALQPGELSEVVSTGQGFHIIRLNQRSGQSISTQHILVSVSEEELDDDYAINKLTAIRDSILYHHRSFADMARLHSDDRNTAPAGGRLINPQTGQRLIPIQDLDPSLHRIVLLLEEIGDISPPRSYTYGSEQKPAWRIVKLNQRVEEHIANLEQDYPLIRSFALQEKSERLLSQWIHELRDEMYVEYRIPVPELQPLDQPDLLEPAYPDHTHPEI